LTYDALDRDSNKLARGLQKLGVKRGDRVAVSLGNNAEFATLTYALFKLGAILVCGVRLDEKVVAANKYIGTTESLVQRAPSP
jgi:non-ribosomal peptide synthetase component E (peptide arylation enzyme)